MILDIIYGLKYIIIGIVTFPGKVFKWIGARLIAVRDFLFKPKKSDSRGKINQPAARYRR